MNTFSLAELAQRFELELVGDGSTLITGLCTLAPGEPGKLGFLANPHYRMQLADTGAAAVIVGKRDAENLSTPGLLAPDPYLAFARIAKLFDRSRQFSAGIDATAAIDVSAQIGAGCQIGAYCVIEAEVILGERCVVGPGSVLRRGCHIGPGGRLEARVMVGEGVQIGARVLIQPGAVIGSRGFGNARLPDGSWEEVPQLGSVLIGDDVEVGANTTIDRGALGDTVIEDGVKLDNQIQIAHNCVIGAHTAIAGAAGIAGSTKVGRRCMIGGAVNIGGHLVIADDVVLLGRAMVTGSITQAGVYGSGLPHAPAREWRKQVARVRRLHLLEARVKLLEHALKLKPCEDDNNEGEA